MALRLRPAVGFLVFVVMLVAGLAPLPQAQTRASGARSTSSGQANAAAKWVVPRTADGHPDFQGVWANNTVTPLQRPKQWEGKTRLTDAEIGDLQKIAARITENDGDAQFGDGLIAAVLNRVTKPNSYDPGTGNYNQFWVVERDWHDRRTSLIVDPPNGQLPPRTPEAEKRRAAEIEHRKAHAFEDPEVFPLGERCVNFSTPRLQAGYNSYFQIVQAPGHVMVMAEMAHDARIIPTDGRPHLPPGIRPWNGDSRGHWDGDTLVVETTNLTDRTSIGLNGNGLRHSDRMKMTEKIRRVAENIVQYQLTVDDPVTYPRPFTISIPLTPLDGGVLLPYECHEGNMAVRNALAAERQEDRALAADLAKGIKRERRSAQEGGLGAGGFGPGGTPGNAPGGRGGGGGRTGGAPAEGDQER
jgi:hypothetical protein